MQQKSYNCVMLVDDNDVDNYISQRMIELSNFAENVIVKNNGKSALEYLEERQFSADELPDIIFLDISMSIVDGYVFLYEFEKYSEMLKNKSKVVILTSSDNKQDMDRMNDNEFVFKYVTKPLTEATLNEIRTLI